ncbi:hypothetical protein MLP_27990 [Microlunatus phosphovorus NM-1]|uniref:DUF222 domain-containing protein n=1 Tax=Microlunatus phosphovorus (strain ATCC 700054 / DSM 10555 / JCM 9379 / NBRC 101784 / NCIMB 13414 / VKM Ac-1990 / NM-1) TaxID=1032480 RepID=F5XIE4_MICPN|nr:hypothetical protein MLP_27990 [Microlunatus phosphovorus NM-1]
MSVGCSTVSDMSTAAVMEAIGQTDLPDTAAGAAAAADTPAAPDDVTVRLDETLDWLHSLVSARGVDQGLVSDAARIDRIAVCERLQASLEAVKAVEMVAFAQSQSAEQMRLGVHPRKIGGGIADQIALACKVSPTEGSRRLHVARDLVLDMPHTLDLLATGEIGGWTTRLIVGQLSHLDRATRARLDAELAGKDLGSMGAKQAEAAAKRLAYEADPAAATERAKKARKDRRVTLRPAPDTMSLLTGLLPVEQGVACYAALDAAAKTAKAAGDTRSRGQIMADTLVARLTGQEKAEDTGFEVGVIMPLGALLDPGDQRPAELIGQDLLPADLIRDLIKDAEARCWWRRLFTRPTGDGGQLIVDADKRRRTFASWLVHLIRCRDKVCQDPYCGAPIRHLDHIHRHADGGAATATNGRGVCERGNYIRELPGWTVQIIDTDTHTVEIITPTGHHYRSRPPEPP